MLIGSQINQIRQSRGMTQEQLAILVGTTKSAISRYENNLRTPGIEQLQRIAGALNVPLSELVGTTDAIQEAVFSKLQKAKGHLNASKEAESPYIQRREQMQAVMSFIEGQNLAEQSNAVEEQAREGRKKTLISVYDKLNSACQEKVLGYAEGLAEDEENIVQYVTIPSPFPDPPEPKKQAPGQAGGGKENTE